LQQRRGPGRRPQPARAHSAPTAPAAALPAQPQGQPALALACTLALASPLPQRQRPAAHSLAVLHASTPAAGQAPSDAHAFSLSLAAAAPAGHGPRLDAAADWRTGVMAAAAAARTRARGGLALSPRLVGLLTAAAAGLATWIAFTPPSLPWNAPLQVRVEAGALGEINSGAWVELNGARIGSVDRTDF